MASKRGYDNEWKLGKLENNYQASLLAKQEGIDEFKAAHKHSLEWRVCEGQECLELANPDKPSVAECCFVNEKWLCQWCEEETE